MIVLVIIILMYMLYVCMPASAPKPTILWFFSETCGHCTRMEPAWREFAKKCPAYIELKKINTAENQQMAREYGVSGVPYIVKVIGVTKTVYEGNRSAQDLYDFATATL